MKKSLGLIAFAEAREAFKAEAFLKKSGYDVKLAVPPPESRKGCDLAVEFNIVEKVGVENLLKDKGVNFLDIVSIDTPSTRPLDAVKVFDYGDSVMIRCGALKITIEKGTGLIRNVSGGGCPDVPFLYIELVDRRISEARRPKELGYSLCALCLDRAFEEALRLHESGYLGHSPN